MFSRFSLSQKTLFFPGFPGVSEPWPEEIKNIQNFSDFKILEERSLLLKPKSFSPVFKVSLVRHEPSCFYLSPDKNISTILPETPLIKWQENSRRCAWQYLILKYYEAFIFYQLLDSFNFHKSKPLKISLNTTPSIIERSFIVTL